MSVHVPSREADLWFAERKAFNAMLKAIPGHDRAEAKSKLRLWQQAEDALKKERARLYG